ncbi:efflux RND transporter periplasmic adaptor subunit [Cylindrospermum sp. FACHB-282]|uniref:efflux RND transporter periplasmic adaptor subunit n=1 Tax=Cylindrospermum sp. FACHB-282 TaxID=2692794 RepID=UPI0016894B25|nr:HlyD family efflux transporter periplasmic adaptor subunit [Cylindrospermum sp. FACHB-282]MBD2384609.1 biotin/lipoyl-binding protein [Cylindrospermum sp. FACHB-282]
MKNFKFKPGFKWLTISASLTVVTLGGWLVFGSVLKSNTQPVTVSMVTVTQGEVENKITGESGILKLDNQRTIKFPTTGTVEQVLVKIGDTVKKDQVLIRLRDAESQIKLQEFESDLKDKSFQISDKNLALQRATKKLLDSKKEYQNIQKTYLQDIANKKQEILWEIEKAKLDFNKKQQAISQAESTLAEAKVKLEENQQLFARDFISKDGLKDQEKQVTGAESSLTTTKDELSLSKINLEKQELDLKSFLENVKNNKSEPQQKFQEAQSKVEQAQQELNQAKIGLNQVVRELEKTKIQRQKIAEELRKTVIMSPVDGVILNLQVKVGDVIEPKGDVLLIGDPTQQIVELKLSPLDATQIKLRQQAEISVLGLESKKITGKIQQISLLAGEAESNNNQNSDNVKLTAIVRLDQVNKNIVPGTPVTVTLILSRLDKVMVIPNEAIQQTESETFVWMQNAQGKALKKPIKLGLQGLDNVQVKSGVKIGDEVLIPSFETKLNEGNYVSVKLN